MRCSRACFCRVGDLAIHFGCHYGVNRARFDLIVEQVGLRTRTVRMPRGKIVHDGLSKHEARRFMVEWYRRKGSHLLRTNPENVGKQVHRNESKRQWAARKKAKEEKRKARAAASKLRAAKP